MGQHTLPNIFVDDEALPTSELLYPITEAKKTIFKEHNVQLRSFQGTAMKQAYIWNQR
jgi:hypothetical protein